MESGPKNLTQQARQRADKVIVPGSQNYHNLFDSPEFPRFLAHAKGPYVWDLDGNRYVDLFMGSGTVILGHGHQGQLEWIWRNMSHGATVSLRHPIEIELAEWFRNHMSFAHRSMFFKTGSEAAHAAVQLAADRCGRSTIISLGYHGWLTPFRQSWPPSKVNFLEADWDLDTAVKAIREQNTSIAAVIVSPDPCMLKPEFYLAIEVETHRYGALFIMDEIKSGFRFKFPCLSVAFGLSPDIALFSKAISNGFPLAVLVGKNKFLSNPEALGIFSTFASETVSLFAARYCMNLLKNGAYEEFESASLFLYSKLRLELNGKNLSVVGEPTFFRIAFPDNVDKKRVACELAERGFLYHPWDEVLISAAHNDEALLKSIIANLSETLHILGVLEQCDNSL